MELDHINATRQIDRVLVVVKEGGGLLLLHLMWQQQVA
jgi:hypothetical protein